MIQQCCSPKARNRPSFKYILLHLEMAASEVLATPPDQYIRIQNNWKEELREQFVKAKTRRSHSKVEEAMIRKRKEELKHAQDIREHYMKKLDRTHNLYLQLNAYLAQLKAREKDLKKYDFKYWCRL